jgi:hypothetical protein
MLDDPSRDLAARASTLSLVSYSVALIGYRTVVEIKRETDEAFSEAFPWLSQHRISLTKLRFMRNSLMGLWRSLNLELSSLALGLVYFEKLVWSHCFEKGNAAVVLGSCCLLGHKFNEPQADGGGEFVREHLLPRLASVLKVSAAALLRHEFTVWTRLGFGLHVPLAEVLPQFERLLSDATLDIEQYLQLDAIVQRPDPAGSEQRRPGGAPAHGLACDATPRATQSAEVGCGSASDVSSECVVDLGWVYASRVHYDYRNDLKGAEAAGAKQHTLRPFYAPLQQSMGIDAISLGSSSSSSSSESDEALHKDEVSSALSVASSTGAPRRSPVQDAHGKGKAALRTGTPKIGMDTTDIQHQMTPSAGVRSGFALARRSSLRRQNRGKRKPHRRVKSSSTHPRQEILASQV